MRQMYVGDDEIRTEVTRLRQHIPAVAQRQHLMPVRTQQVAKKFKVKFVVLDNEHALCHQSPALPLGRLLYSRPSPENQIMRSDIPNGKQETDGDGRPDAPTLALMALAWTVADDRRADRLLGLTGLDAAALRQGAGDPAILAAILAFLADHEPDLVACAEAIDSSPAALIAAKERLSR